MTPEQYNSKTAIILAAKKAGRFRRVLWQTLAAQAGQESQFGKFLSAPFNCMGIKWSAGSCEEPGEPHWTMENTNDPEKKAERIRVPFVAYRDWQMCMDHAARKIKNQHVKLTDPDSALAFGRYMAVMDRIADFDNPTREELKAACEALEGVWATDKLYAEGLMEIIEREGWIADSAKRAGGVQA